MANSRLCSVLDCDKPSDRRGLCTGHYMRQRRNGSPTAGRTGRGVAAEFVKTATLYAGTDCLIWPYTRTKGGYATARVDGSQLLVSRYLCSRVHGPAPSNAHQAAHSCGNGHLGCVNPLHLSWKTGVENEADKQRHGTQQLGSRHPNAVLDEETVREIRRLRETMRFSEIVRHLGLNRSTVSNVFYDRMWTHVDDRNVTT